MKEQREADGLTVQLSDDDLRIPAFAEQVLAQDVFRGDRFMKELLVLRQAANELQYQRYVGDGRLSNHEAGNLGLDLRHFSFQFAPSAETSASICALVVCSVTQTSISFFKPG